MVPQKAIAITVGEPAGVGPELVAQLVQSSWPMPLVVLGNVSLIKPYLPPDFAYFAYQPDHCEAGKIYWLDIPLDAKVIPGELNIANVPHVMRMLERAVQGALSKEFAAIVTGPVHKGIINEAGIPFSGHTEFFAHAARVQNPVMLLLNESMKVALVTTHLPLQQVPHAITPKKLTHTLLTLHTALVTQFGITAPRIGVCGLNPHAGENGHMGREEIAVIIPVLEKLRAQGLNLMGPLAADTAFLPNRLTDFDAFVAMYHDQGLPVIKHAGFNTAVNMTLGLPFIRTSVDHGTALELAGKGTAEVGSFKCALEIAIEILNAV